jgi:hypothetical protein
MHVIGGDEGVRPSNSPIRPRVGPGIALEVAVIESDLPPPRCGVPIVGDNGQIYWVDMVWDEQRVIGEADGAMKYADPEAIVREKRRQEALEGAGWRVVRWGWSEVMPDAGVMLRRLRRALTAPTRPESL